MTSLRQRLQEIWGDPVVRCPHHQVWWHDGVHATMEGIVSGRDHSEAKGLFWSKGKKYPPTKPPRERLP
jgi:hypothetical protein